MISIIIPVYNSGKYLSRCIQSILSNTFTDLEIILINDGSKDNSREICRQYAEKDQRIIFFDRENNYGVSSSRNLGIEKAKGDYIAFIDSDDQVKNNYFEELYSAITNYNADVATCGYLKQGVLCFATERKPICSIKREDICKEIFVNKNIGVTVWAKLFRKSVISDIRFENGTISEDELFCFTVFARCGKIVKVDKALYLYTFNERGLTYGSFGLRHIDFLPMSYKKLLIIKDAWYDMLPKALYIAACSFIDIHIEYARKKLKDYLFKDKLLKNREELYGFFQLNSSLMSELINKKINFYYKNLGKIMFGDRLRFIRNDIIYKLKKIIKGMIHGR